MPIQDIYSNALQPIRSPDQVQAGLAQNALAQAQLQHSALQARQMQTSMDEADALREAYRRGADPSTPEGRAALVKAAPLQAPKLFQDQAALQETQAKTANQNAQAGKHTLESRAMGVAQLAQGMRSIDPNNDGQIVNLYKQAVDSGLLTQDAAMQEINAIPPAGSPERAQWHQTQVQKGMTLVQQMEQQLGQAKLKEETRAHDLTAQTSLATNAATNATHLKTAGMAQAGENSRAALARETQLRVAGLGPDSQNEGVSPAAIENAAARYNVDGTLPPMGMGAAGAAGRRAILNRAAELAIGTSGTDQRINQMDAKAAGSALTQLSKSKTMASSFERTANANAELALGLSEKMDRTGVPLINAGLQALRTGTGSPEATQWAAATTTFVNEYAKIMSGGMGNGPTSDSARAKAEKLLTTQMTAEQFKGNVRLLQKEMTNRMNGFADEEKALRSRLGGKTEAPAAAPAPAGLPQGWKIEKVGN